MTILTVNVQKIKHDVCMTRKCCNVQSWKTVTRGQSDVGAESNEQLSCLQVSVKAALMQSSPPFRIVLVDVDQIRMMPQEWFKFWQFHFRIDKSPKLLLALRVKIRFVILLWQQQWLHWKVGHGTQWLQHLVVLGGKSWFPVDMRLVVAAKIFFRVNPSLPWCHCGKVLGIAFTATCWQWWCHSWQGWHRRGSRWRAGWWGWWHLPYFHQTVLCWFVTSVAFRSKLNEMKAVT